MIVKCLWCWKPAETIGKRITATCSVYCEASVSNANRKHNATNAGKETNRKSRLKYYQKNKDLQIARAKIWIKTHPNEATAYRKKYTENHKEELRIKSYLYCQSHRKEKATKARLKYQQSPELRERERLRSQEITAAAKLLRELGNPVLIYNDDGSRDYQRERRVAVKIVNNMKERIDAET